MTCTHQFIAIEQITRPSQVVGGRIQDTHGVRVGCAICGQIRVVWETGEVISETTGAALKSNDHSAA